VDIYSEVKQYRKVHIRYRIVFMLFIFSALSYSERSVLSIAGADISNQLSISPLMMGYIFSAFGWAYVLGQVPGGILIDRFGTRRVYSTVIILWTIFAFLHIFAAFTTVSLAVFLLLVLRFLIGLAAAPIFPANARVVGEWFPMKERGTATAIFSSSQYFSAVLFAPLIGWIAYSFGWQYVFLALGAIGAICAFDWLRNYHTPEKHPRISTEERIFIQNGEAKVKEKEERRKELKEGQKQGKMPVLQLLGNRMIIGIYLSQYCSTAITYFFLTWFPIYLVTEKQMTVLEVGFISMFPALGAFIGQLAGGAFSDSLIKKGLSLSRARKIPIIVGMVCSMTIIGANYTESIVIVILIMSFAFFGRGFGGLGWAIITETSPKKVAGINGAMFNTFGNVAGITTPIIIGYILEVTGSFHMALLFIGGNALVAIFSYTFIVGEIKEVEIY